MAKLNQNEEPKLIENPKFLQIASISSLSLLFTIQKNYRPLLEIMAKYETYDEFIKANAEKTLKDYPNL